jgi:hypothetical protein
LNLTKRWGKRGYFSTGSNLNKSTAFPLTLDELPNLGTERRK